jgi:hypothetical protein
MGEAVSTFDVWAERDRDPPLYEANDMADLIPDEAAAIHDGVGKKLAEP